MSKFKGFSVLFSDVVTGVSTQERETNEMSPSSWSEMNSSIDLMKFPKSNSLLTEEDETFVYQQHDFTAQGFPVMEEIRRQGKLCDVTIKVDDQSFSAHRIVLAATIPYFHAMFTIDMVESSRREITIQGIEASSLEALINFSYSGKVTIDPSNVQSLMVGASFLQLTNVRNACADYLIKRFHPHNVLGIRSFADSLGCIPLLESADKYLQQCFHFVSTSEEFLNLSFKELNEIIRRDELNVLSEEQVFEAVMNWVKKDPESRKKDLPPLLGQVRLPLLSPQYLTDNVATEEFIRSSHECRDLLDEARDYHLMPERRILLQGFRTRPRDGYITGYIFAVGGLTKSGESLSTVEVYDPTLSRWQKAAAMTMLRSRVGVAVMKNKLYAVGGYNGCDRLNAVEVFNPQEGVWSTIAPMHHKRSAIGAAVLNDRLYVCGGYDGVTSLNSAECYQPDADEWTFLPPMAKHRSAGGVVSFEGYIYVFGGHDGLSIFDSVERYDPHAKRWTPVTSMLSKRCRLGVATLNRKIYICGGYDGSTFLQTAEVYDPIKDEWQFIAPMNVMRSRVSLVANVGKLWAIGGYDGNSNLSTVEVYDPQKNSWSFEAPMCAHEGGVGVGVIPIQCRFNDLDECGQSKK